MRPAFWILASILGWIGKDGAFPTRHHLAIACYVIGALAVLYFVWQTIFSRACKYLDEKFSEPIYRRVVRRPTDSLAVLECGHTIQIIRHERSSFACEECRLERK